MQRMEAKVLTKKNSKCRKQQMNSWISQRPREESEAWLGEDSDSASTSTKCGNSTADWVPSLPGDHLRQSKSSRTSSTRLWEDCKRTVVNRTRRSWQYKALTSISQRKYKHITWISRETLARIMSHPEVWKPPLWTSSCKSRVSSPRCPWWSPRSRHPYTIANKPRRDTSSTTMTSTTWRNSPKVKLYQAEAQTRSQPKTRMTILWVQNMDTACTRTLRLSPSKRCQRMHQQVSCQDQFKLCSRTILSISSSQETEFKFLVSSGSFTVGYQEISEAYLSQQESRVFWLRRRSQAWANKISKTSGS